MRTYYKIQFCSQYKVKINDVLFFKKSIASLYFLILGMFQLLLGSSINSKKLRDYLIGIPVFQNNNYFYLKNI